MSFNAANFPPVIQLPDYELLRRIDDGAFGEVWLARAKATERWRAVKIVFRDRFDNDLPFDTEFSGVRKFEEVSREHEGFVDILHISRDEQGRHFACVMELADDLDTGQQLTPAIYKPRTLRHELSRKGRLHASECVKIALALIAGLAELHRRGLVHRDVKPSNIVFIRGAPKLADIGLVTEIANRETGGPHFMTPAYADEVVHGTAAGDLYSFGKVFYEMATGLHAEQWPTWPPDVEKAPDFREFCDLDEIFCKACHPDRAKRYQHAEEIQSELLFLRAGASMKRYQRLDRLAKALRRYGLFILGLFLMAGLAAYLWSEQNKRAAELLQRRVGSYVAYGSRAIEEGDLLGSLPWFIEALRLDALNPQAQENHRLRIASVLHSSPRIVSMWFSRGDICLATFAGQEDLVFGRPPDDLRWCLMDLKSGQAVSPLIGLGGVGEYAAYSAASGRAVTGDQSRTNFLWDARTGQRLRALTYEPAALNRVALSPDGRWVASCAGATAILWDTRVTQPPRELRHHTGNILSLAFSPDHQRLLTTSADGTAAIWSAAEAKPLRVLADHGTWVYGGAFSPNGRQVATACHDRAARIWDVETGQLVVPPLWHADGVHSAEFDPSGERLVTADLGFVVRVWDLKKGNLLQVLRHNTKPVYAAFSPQGHHIITCTWDGTSRVWDLRERWAVRSLPAAAIAGDLSRYAVVTNGAVEVMALPQATLIGTLPLPRSEVKAVVFGGQGRHLLATTERTNNGPVPHREARVWQIPELTPVGKVLLPPPDLTPQVVSPGGTYVAAFNTNQCWVWEVASARPALQLTQAAQVVSFDPPAQRVAIGAGTNVQIYPLPSGLPVLRRALPHPVAVHSIEWSRDARRMVTGCWDNTFDHEAAQVWNPQNGRRVGAPLQHRDGLLFAAFSPAGERVITCSEDFTAVLWDASTGSQLTPPLQHRHQVRHAAFAKGGRWVATASRSGSVRLWDAHTGDPLTPSLMRTEDVAQVFLDPEARLVGAQTEAGLLWLWRLPREERSADELSLIAQLLSGQVTQAPESLKPHSKETLRALWKDLSARHPQQFSFRP